MKSKNFLSVGNAKPSEKRLIKAVSKAIDAQCEREKAGAHLEITINELEPGLNEIVIRLIEGESYKKLIQAIDQQLAEEQAERGGIH